MTAADRLAEIEARISTERILREGDPYYSHEAGAWERNSADLDHAAALVNALRAVLAVVDGPHGTRDELGREGEEGSWTRGNRHMWVAVRRAIDGVLR